MFNQHFRISKWWRNRILKKKYIFNIFSDYGYVVHSMYLACTKYIVLIHPPRITMYNVHYALYIGCLLYVLYSIQRIVFFTSYTFNRLFDYIINSYKLYGLF